jgi:hypothetical protein
LLEENDDNISQDSYSSAVSGKGKRQLPRVIPSKKEAASINKTLFQSNEIELYKAPLESKAQVDITTDSSVSVGRSKARGRNFYEFNRKSDILNMYCSPIDSLAELVKPSGKPDIRDLKFKRDLNESGVTLKIHIHKQHKSFDDFPHYRSNVVRSLLTKKLAENGEYSNGFELYVDPTKAGTNRQRNICNFGNIPRLTDRDFGRIEMMKGKSVSPNFCDCKQWVQCPHMPKPFENNLVVLKDAGYYGCREIETLLHLGYRVLVVGWHYKDASEAYDEVQIFPTETEGQYRHCWAGDESGTDGYIHEMPSEISWPKGEFIMGFGSYKAILYSPTQIRTPQEEGLSKPDSVSRDETLLGPGLDAEGLMNHKYQGDYIKSQYYILGRGNVTSMYNALVSDLGQITQNEYALDWPHHYAQILVDKMASTSTDLSKQTTAWQRQDMRNADSRKKDLLHDYDGSGACFRILGDSLSSFSLVGIWLPRNWEIRRQPRPALRTMKPPDVETMEATADVTHGIFSTIVAVPGAVIDTINS